MDISADFKWLYVGNATNTARAGSEYLYIIDTEPLQVCDRIRVLRPNTQYSPSDETIPRSASVLADGKLLLSVFRYYSGGGSIFVYDPTTGEFTIPDSVFYSASPVPSRGAAKAIAVAQYSYGTVAIYDSAVGGFTESSQLSSGWLGAVASRPDGKQFVVSGSSLFILDEHLQKVFSLQLSGIRNIAYAPDGSRIYVRRTADYSVEVLTVIDSSTGA